jgi:hypothetical protein
MTAGEKQSPWVYTVNGGQVPLLNPTPEHIHVMDIAEGLSKQCRYNGQVTSFYSVAQHSCVVMKLLPDEIKPYGLLHDAHEAYIGDMVSPMKKAINEMGSLRAITRITRNLDEAIYRAFGLKFPIPSDVKELIIHADMTALATEKRDLLNAQQWDVILPEPANFKITPMAWPVALEKFVEAIYECTAWNPNITKSHAFKKLNHGQDTY